MSIELGPGLPAGVLEAVARALEGLLDQVEASPGAWWAAGVLGDGAVAEEPWGDPRVVEP